MVPGFWQIAIVVVLVVLLFGRGKISSLMGDVVLPNGSAVNAEKFQEPVSDEYYFIVPDKCTECKGFHDEPQCAAVCPVDCCVPDDNHVETEDTLIGKQQFMHPES